MTLDDQVQAWLASQSKSGVNGIDYTLLDRGEGNGPEIGAWNADTLGKLPTDEELDSVTPQAEAFAAKREQDTYTATVQAWLDATARDYNYSDIVAACSYAGSANDLWHRQGLAFTEWRDAVWQSVFDAFAVSEYPPQAMLPQPEIPTV